MTASGCTLSAQNWEAILKSLLHSHRMEANVARMRPMTRVVCCCCLITARHQPASVKKAAKRELMGPCTHAWGVFQAPRCRHCNPRAEQNKDIVRRWVQGPTMRPSKRCLRADTGGGRKLHGANSPDLDSPPHVAPGLTPAPQPRVAPGLTPVPQLLCTLRLGSPQYHNRFARCAWACPSTTTAFLSAPGLAPVPQREHFARGQYRLPR